jgi:hypothetical protein
MQRQGNALQLPRSIHELQKLSLTLYIELFSFKDLMPSKISIIIVIDSFNRLRKQFMVFLDAIGILAYSF